MELVFFILSLKKDIVPNFFSDDASIMLSGTGHEVHLNEH